VADPLAEIDGLLNGLNQQVDDQIQQQMDQAVAGVKQGMQGTSVEQPAAPVEPAPPVFRGDGAQVHAQSGIPAGSSPQERSPVHPLQEQSFLVPNFNEINQVATYLLNCPHIAGNKQFSERIDLVDLKIDLEDPTVNAFATDRGGTQIIILGGLIRSYRLIAAGLAMDMTQREQKGSPSHMLKLFQSLASTIVTNRESGIQHEDIDALYSECLENEFDAASGSDKDRFFSLGRSLSSSMEMSVIAHEAGHIAYAHTLGRDQNFTISQNQERDADSFAASCLSSCAYSETHLLGQVFSMLILCWVDYADGSAEVSSHPDSVARVKNIFTSHGSAAANVEKQYGLTVEKIQGFLPPTGGV
jgi:hypothetical protein